jgi:hypothetical protein
VANVSPLLRAPILAGVEAPGARGWRQPLAAQLIEDIRAASRAPWEQVTASNRPAAA